MITITGPGWAVALVLLTIYGLSTYAVWSLVVSPLCDWIERRMIRNFAAKWNITEERAEMIWRTVKRRRRHVLFRIEGKRERARQEAGR